ncbi:MAG: endoribonuclease MazF [Proteobacteria bacterium]|nr:endoribonuclease MazF [Pseudomonadota bacterium]
MVTAEYRPDRGDVVWLNFHPQAGHEQAGRRPALILSPTNYNIRTRLALVCPITSRVKGYPFEVPLPSGLAVTGVVLADHLKSVDWSARKAELVCKVSTSVLGEVGAKLRPLLGL